MTSGARHRESSESGRPEGRDASTAAALSVLVPGAGHLYGGRRLRGVLLLVLGVAPVAAAGWLALARPATVAKLAVQPSVLLWLLAANAVYLGYRVLVTVDAYRGLPRRPATWLRRTAVGGLLAAGLLVPHAAIAYYDLVQYDLITSVFAAPPATTVPPPPPTTTTTGPVDDSAPGTTTASAVTTATTSPPTTAPPTPTTTTAADPWGGRERLNVLLLGSDAGVGRFSVRTDTMIVASIDVATGDLAFFSVPRNFARVPLPEGLGVWDCNCFPPIINELYKWGEEHPDVFPGPATPGANAMKAAFETLLGIPVDYYALVDLGGFVEIIDALGGVEITVTERIYDPAYPKEDGGTEVIDFQPGTYRFDGHEALAYARTRRSSDDYSRMGRQRCVLEALAGQADPFTLLRGFPTIAAALKDNVETDIPVGLLPDLVDLALKVDTEQAISIPFLPPTYTSGRTPELFNIPNVDLIREHVRIATTLPPAEAIATLGIEPLSDVCG